MLNERLLSPLYSRHRQLKSRHPFVPAALKLSKDFLKSDISVGCWAETKWNTKWQSNTSHLRTFIPDVNLKPLQMHVPISSWVKLNHLCIGVSLFRSTVHRLGMASTAACKCGVEEQTTDHIIIYCSSFHDPSRRIGLETVDGEIVA